MRGGGRCSSEGASCREILSRRLALNRMQLERASRNPAASDLAAERGARPARLSLRRLARRRGPDVVAGPAARAARRLTGSPYMSPSAFAGSPGLLAEPRRAVTQRGARGVRRAARATGSTTGRAARAAARRGPGALRARVARASRAMPPSAASASSATCRSTSPHGSADHRAHPELFQTGVVAGVPPDAFAATGQLWGNPLYDWPAMRARRLPLVDRALPPRRSSSST